MNGSLVRVATIVAEPYVLGPNESLKYTDGLEIRILHALSQQLNFQIEHKQTPRGENPWVFNGSGGKHLGLFGLLDRREVDVLFHGVRQRLDRKEIGEAVLCHTFDSLVWVVPVKSTW